MKHGQAGGGACEQIHGHLDAYISNELPPETRAEVTGHLETCSACSAETAIRMRIRSQLKAAVGRQTVPVGLSVRVRQQIRGGQSLPWFLGGWFRWSTAMAAGLFLAVGIWLHTVPGPLPSLTDRPAQTAFIQKISATIADVLSVGLQDHVHCSIFRKYPKDPPTVAQMETDLGPEYKELLALVQGALPSDFRVVMAHHCGYANRKFIHLTMRNDSNLVSLVIAKKEPGETMSGLSAELTRNGVPVYQSTAERYQVAGFESGDYLAFVVSNMGSDANLRIAANLAPAVHQFLSKVAG